MNKQLLTATELHEIRDKKAPLSIEAIISQAIDKKTPVETMERLLAMWRQMKADRAKEEYIKALAAFQKDCPTIKKTKPIYERDKQTIRYYYAPIDSIIEQVKKPLAKHGFSYNFGNVKQVEANLIVSLVVYHKAGHSEVYEHPIPIGSEQYMTEVQKYGARITFAKRYLFIDSFGIMTGDEDTDANESPKVPSNGSTIGGNYPISYDQQKKIFALLKEKNISKEELDTNIRQFFKKDSITKLTVVEANKIISGLEKAEVRESGEVDPDDAEKGIEEMKKNAPPAQDF